MSESAISMAIFNSHVSLLEGISCCDMFSHESGTVVLSIKGILQLVRIEPLNCMSNFAIFLQKFTNIDLNHSNQKLGMLGS